MTLQKIRWKNILSYGQNWTEIQLNNNLINLIIGKNGKGKTTFIDAISFALTGKPYRDINKAQLVNSINKKGLLVELFFKNGTHDYIVRRGVKPNIFEILKDGELLDQSAKVVDYQKILDDIIKIDLKTLKQSIIMSSKYYKPFLEMTKAEKRFYIEEILNIKQFSIMSDQVKALNRNAKQELGFLEKDIERIESNITLIQSMKEQNAQQNEVKQDEILKEIEKIETTILNHKNDKGILEKQVAELQSKYDKHKDKYAISRIIENKLCVQQNEAKRITKDMNFLEHSTTCGTCKQEITLDYKSEMSKEYQFEIDKVNIKITDLMAKKEKIDTITKKLDAIERKMNTENENVYWFSVQIETGKTNIARFKKELNTIQQPATDETDKEVALVKEQKTTEKKINKLNKDLKYYSILLKLLADDGIKRYIVEQYLNVFNSYVNKYLELLSTNYRIKFNDEFEEKIVASGYEKLQYGNFSSGERQRLDLAILFAFVELAKNRNSVNCNVLFLDEIADSALDEEGVTGMFKILEHLKHDGYTTYLISHREGVTHYCDRTLVATKKTFSTMQEVG